MFIAPRDVSVKIDGGEGSHGIDNRGRKAPSTKSLSVSMVMAPDTEYSGTERSPPAKKYTSQHNPIPEIPLHDRYKYT